MATTKTAKPRGKKVSPSKEPEVQLTEEQVWDVLKFANTLYGGALQANIYTPDLINARIKNITSQPQVATLDKITEALSTPNESEEQLIGYSQWLELNSILYRRVLLYFSGLLSFDYTYVIKNLYDPKEYKTKKYKDDYKIVQDFFDRFNVKDIFKTVMREMLRNETYFGVLRDEGEKYILQELPRNRCKITGRWDYGLLYDFDMMWFIQPSVPLEMYPPFFTKVYKKIFLNGELKPEYKPYADLNHRTGSFTYWTQTSPEDGFVAFKLFQELGTNIPFLAPFMPDAVMQPIIRELQTNSYIAKASKIIAGSVPFLKDAKSSVKDAIALDPNTLGKFLALMKSSLPSVIKVASAPLENISAIEFNGDSDLYDSYLETSASASGINSRLIYSKDRQNLLETKLSLDIDQNILRPVYEMFAGMLEYWVNKRTKTYKFKFLFEGFETSVNREERIDAVFKYAESGIVLEQKFASALSISPFDFRRMMMDSQGNEFVSKLTPIIKASQTPAGAGRPPQSDSSLSDSGAETREAGSNVEKSEE